MTLSFISQPPEGYQCYDSNGLSEWQLSGSARLISAKKARVYEDDGNGGTFSGTADLYVSPCGGGTITIDVDGMIETLDPGFDWVRVSIDGNEVLYIESTEDNEVCGYESASGTYDYIIPAGHICPIHIFAEAASDDGVCNEGVYWDVEVSKS